MDASSFKQAPEIGEMSEAEMFLNFISRY